MKKDNSIKNNKSPIIPTLQKEKEEKIKIDNSSYNFPIDKSKLSIEFLKKFEIKNIDFKVDKFEELILQDVMRFDENTRVKLSRDMTKMFGEWMEDKIKKKENIALSIKGTTRCLVGDSKILMANFSEKSIKDCKVGDFIFTFNEKTFETEIKPILKIWENEIKEIYEICLKGGETIRCSKEHKFIKGFTKEVYKGKRKNNNSIFKREFKNYNWEELKDFNKGDLIGLFPSLNNFYNKTKYSLNDLELLGFTLADGSIIRSINFGLLKKDKIDYLFYLVENSKWNIKINQKKNYNLKSGYYISNKEYIGKSKSKNKFHQILLDLKLFGTTSRTKFIPREIKQSSKKEIYAFLSGLFNGDCSIQYNKGISYVSVSNILINDLKILLNKLNINYTFRCRKINYHYPDNLIRYSYEINITRFPDILELYKNMNWTNNRINALKKYFDYFENRDKPKDYSTHKIYKKNNLKFKRIKSITKLKKKKTYDLNVEDNHNYCVNNFLVKNSGKSIVTLKFTSNNVRYYDKPFDTRYIVCANQKEYRLKLNKASFGDVFQIDENAFANVGEGSMTETHQLKDIQNIIAKQNIHTYYITPKVFLTNNAELGLSYWGKDVNNWCSRFLLYSLKNVNPILMGYVVINVGSLFTDYGCFLFKMFGGCANSNRLKLLEITNGELVFENFQNPREKFIEKHSIDYLKYSSCITKEYKKVGSQSLIANSQTEDDKEKMPCPFYRICHQPMCNYEHKKDEWIAKEMKGGMDERSSERFRVALELIKKIGFYDDENNRFMLKAKGKSDLKIKVSLFLPKISNSKFTGTETETIINTIQSLSDVEVLTETCNLLELDLITELRGIEGTQNLINSLNDISKSN